jgi:hypothetical protein
MDQDAEIPVPMRISPTDYVIDPQAFTRGEALFEGHRWRAGKEEVIEWAEEDEETWYLDVLRSLVTSDAAASESANSDEKTERDEITLYTIWAPHTKHEDAEENKHHGTLYTLGVTGGDGGHVVDFVRPPRPFFGPKDGPYSVCAVYYVPDDPFGLSPFTAIEGQRKDLNVLARAVNDRAIRAKRVVLVDENDPTLADKIATAKDDLVIPVRGFDRNRVLEIAMGGVEAGDYQVLEYLRHRLERMVGLTDAQRGSPRGSTTATEAAIADEASDRRTDYIKLQFHRHVKRISEKAAWYIDQAEDVVIPLPETARDELQRLGVEVPDGAPLHSRSVKNLPGVEDLPFEDLELEIEPMSMVRMSEGLKRQQVTEVFGLIAQITQLAPMAPFVKWDRLVGMVGESFNMPGLGDLIDMDGIDEAAQQIQAREQMEMEQRAQGPQQQSKPQQPRTGLPGNQTGARLAGAARSR